MTRRRLVVVGAGGHARVVTALLSLLPEFSVVGVLDRAEASIGERIGPSRVIGTWAELAALRQQGIDAAAVALGDNRARAEVFEHLRALGYALPILCHPSALVEPGAQMADGTLLAAGTIIGADAQLGRNVIINTGATIDHECRIADHVHVAPGCHVAGRVTIGARTFVGIGTAVRDGLTIGADVCIGAGSVVIHDIADGALAYGVPARVRTTPAPA